jgi:uncharacterized protein YoxC
MSPTRPPSVRKRQSMQIMDLQTQLEHLAAQNRSLEEARARAEETLQATSYQREVDAQFVNEAADARDREIQQKDIDIAQLHDTLQRLQGEIARLTELNNNLTQANQNLTNDVNQRYAQLQAEGQAVHDQWQQSTRELEELRAQHNQLTGGMEDAIRGEIALALDDRNAEIERLNTELANAREQILSLQKQILSSKKPNESFLTVRDEDYFDSACQQLCQHVQQWVLRFSKFSDTRACRLSSEIAADTRLDAATRQKIDTRLDNAILDGSDVDMLLADRVKRRDVFMSVTMTMIWEYVFTRYLFGMDREQRQKLKSLEKTLSEVGMYTSSPHQVRPALSPNGELSHSPSSPSANRSFNNAPKTPKPSSTRSTVPSRPSSLPPPTSSAKSKNPSATSCASPSSSPSKCAPSAPSTSCCRPCSPSTTPTATSSLK